MCRALLRAQYAEQSVLLVVDTRSEPERVGATGRCGAGQQTPQAGLGERLAGRLVNDCEAPREESLPTAQASVADEADAPRKPPSITGLAVTGVPADDALAPAAANVSPPHVAIAAAVAAAILLVIMIIFFRRGGSVPSVAFSGRVPAAAAGRIPRLRSPAGTAPSRGCMPTAVSR